jgi:hypothetical protein
MIPGVLYGAYGRPSSRASFNDHVFMRLSGGTGFGLTRPGGRPGNRLVGRCGTALGRLAVPPKTHRKDGALTQFGTAGTTSFLFLLEKRRYSDARGGPSLFEAAAAVVRPGRPPAVPEGA